MINVTFVTNDSKVVSVAEVGNLLRISIREKGGIPFKCGGGICGTCRCRIEQGLEYFAVGEQSLVIEARPAVHSRPAPYCESAVH